MESLANSNETFFNWTRPNSLPYPNIWLKFQSRDINADNLVEYSIEDVPEDRFDEAVEFMKNGFLANAPMAKWKKALSDAGYIEEIIRIWKTILSQRMSLICFRDGTKEIVGLYTTYVSSEDDAPLLFENIKSESFSQILRVHSILQDHGDVDVFGKYGVDKYLSAFGVYVPKKFSGRKIGEKLVEASKYLAQPCGIKLFHDFFTSDISNKIADNVGFKTDAELSFKEIQRIDPSLKFENIESSRTALRTWIFEDPGNLYSQQEGS